MLLELGNFWDFLTEIWYFDAAATFALDLRNCGFTRNYKQPFQKEGSSKEQLEHLRGGLEPSVEAVFLTL